MSLPLSEMNDRHRNLNAGSAPYRGSTCMQVSGTRAEGHWILTIVVVGLALRLAAVLYLDVRPESDYREYQTMALNLIDGKGLLDTFGNRATYNGGYPIFVLAPVFVLFNRSLLAAQLVNAALGALSVYLCYIVAREAGAGRSGRLSAGALWAVYLPSSVYAEYLAKENLMTPLMLGLLWCALRLRKALSLPLLVAILSGILLGVLALAGNSGLALSLVVIASLARSHTSFGEKTLTGLVVGLMALMLTTPWLLRNWRVVGAPVLNTNGGFNLYLGNNPAATGLFMSISDTPRGTTWHTLRQAGELEASSIVGGEAREWILDHPGQFARLALRKTLLLWMPPTHDGLGPGSFLESLIRRLWLVQYLTLVAAAAGGVYLFRRRPGMVTLVIAVAAYTAVHVLYFVSFRYREAIMPVICILAGFSCEAVLAQGQGLRRRREAARIREST